MTQVFETVLNMSMIGSFTIAAVLFARLLFFKSPKKYAYVLWSVVFLRLIIPSFPISDFGVIPAELSYGRNVYIEKVLVTEESGQYAGEEETLQRLPSKAGVLTAIWFAGAVCIGGYHLRSYLKFKRQLGFAVQVEDGVYEMKGEHLSFILGILKPKIYLSGELDEEGRAVVFCHEQIHLKRRDYLIKPAALFVACVHWFNPLVWLAFYLMNRDCEMSCDEAVVDKLGNRCRKVYAYALLNEATRGRCGRCRRESTCAVLSFGEDNIKSRISHVIHFKKAPLWLAAGTMVLVAVFLAGFCSDRFIREHDFAAALAAGCKAVQYEQKGNVGYLTVVMDVSGEEVVVKVTEEKLQEMLQGQELSHISEIIMNLDLPIGKRKQKYDGHVNVWELLKDDYYEQFLELRQINYEGE